jgi:hypothetical protein
MSSWVGQGKLYEHCWLLKGLLRGVYNSSGYIANNNRMIRERLTAKEVKRKVVN